MSERAIAHLGPVGTYAEMAALRFQAWLTQQDPHPSRLIACRSIPATLQTLADGAVDYAVVPVENSVEGSVSATLDSLWQLPELSIQRALILPIAHALISFESDRTAIRQVLSHPQALAQCQQWLQQQVPQAELIPTNSTTEALQDLDRHPQRAVIASTRAAELYQMPIQSFPINDSPDNRTRFWVISRNPTPGGACTSLNFSLDANVPGALVKPLQILADRGINLSRIESRPTKRSLGEYLFFLDLEADLRDPAIATAVQAVADCTEQLRVLGSYDSLDFTQTVQVPAPARS